MSVFQFCLHGLSPGDCTMTFVCVYARSAAVAHAILTVYYEHV